MAVNPLYQKVEDAVQSYYNFSKAKYNKANLPTKATQLQSLRTGKGMFEIHANLPNALRDMANAITQEEIDRLNEEQGRLIEELRSSNVGGDFDAAIAAIKAKIDSFMSNELDKLWYSTSNDFHQTDKATIEAEGGDLTKVNRYISLCTNNANRMEGFLKTKRDELQALKEDFIKTNLGLPYPPPPPPPPPVEDPNVKKANNTAVKANNTAVKVNNTAVKVNNTAVKANNTKKTNNTSVKVNNTAVKANNTKKTNNTSVKVNNTKKANNTAVKVNNTKKANNTKKTNNTNKKANNTTKKANNTNKKANNTTKKANNINKKANNNTKKTNNTNKKANNIPVTTTKKLSIFGSSKSIKKTAPTKTNAVLAGQTVQKKATTMTQSVKKLLSTYVPQLAAPIATIKSIPKNSKNPDDLPKLQEASNELLKATATIINTTGQIVKNFESGTKNSKNIISSVNAATL